MERGDIFRTAFERCVSRNELRATQTILMGAYQAAILDAALKFARRDWRRVKREMRKAGERARKAGPPVLREVTDEFRVFWRA